MPAAQPRRIEFDVRAFRLIQQVQEAGGCLCETPVRIVAQQHIGGFTPIGDNDRTSSAARLARLTS